MEKLGERKIAHIINGHIRKEDLQPWPSGQKHPADAAVRTLLAWLRSARVLSFMDGAATQLEHAPNNNTVRRGSTFYDKRRTARGEIPAPRSGTTREKTCPEQSLRRLRASLFLRPLPRPWRTL